MQEGHGGTSTIMFWRRITKDLFGSVNIKGQLK